MISGLCREKIPEKPERGGDDHGGPLEFAWPTAVRSGIGYDLAKQFAEHGYDLLVAAEDAGIDRPAADLRRDGTADVRPGQGRLATYDGVERLYAAVRRHRPAGRRDDQRGPGTGGDMPGTPSCGTTRRHRRQRDLDRATWPSGCCRTWWAAVRAGCCPRLDRVHHAGLLSGGVQRVEVFVQSFSEASANELKDMGVVGGPR